jgi:membrane peptidoglycan carboxypeptidase
VLYRENRVVAPLQDIPEMTRKAVIATEDARFYAHNGVDFKGTARAAVENFRADQVTQGGSTLTQQYVKNALLQAASTRAGQEAGPRGHHRAQAQGGPLRAGDRAGAVQGRDPRALPEHRLLRQRRVRHGHRGGLLLRQAGRDLTLEEGALLAGMVQRPGPLRPGQGAGRPGDDAAAHRPPQHRAAPHGGRRLHRRGQLAASTAVVPVFNIQPVQSGCENPRVAAPFFCEHVRNVLERTAVGSALGATLQERQDRLLAGGLTIRTTLDPAVQRAVQAAADEQVPREDPFQAATAINSVEPGTGNIKAMAVNRFYSEQELPGHSKVNLATGGLERHAGRARPSSRSC